MIYAGIDVNIITHHRALEAGFEAFGLWTWGMCYAQTHPSNGVLPRIAVLTAFGGRRNILLAKKLVDVGLWILNEDGSWTIWNYVGKNQTSEEIASRRAERKERNALNQRVSRERRLGLSPPVIAMSPVTGGVTVTDVTGSPPSPEPTPPPEPDLFGTAAPPPAAVTRIGKRKPETACPPSEASAGELRDWAERWKIPDGHGEFNGFLDHHRKSDARWRDWSAAWRTWIKNAPKFAPRGSAVPRQALGSAASAPWMNPTENFDFGASK